MGRESRHIGEWIEAPAHAVYAYASDPANLPAWARMRLRGADRLLALLAAVVFLVVGALGFGHGRLFGTFADSTLLNLVHLAFAAAGFAFARRGRDYLLGGGIASLVLWLVGVAALGGWIPLDAADNRLHLALGTVMLLALLPGGEDLGDDLERDLGGSLPAELQADRPTH